VKVLMFGWEFPPYKSGGLGTACFGLTKGLASQNVDVTFVMPVAPDSEKTDFVKLIGANNLAKKIKLKEVDTILKPYQTSEEYSDYYSEITSKSSKNIYGKDLYKEVKRYSEVAKIIARTEKHDIIHCHDWMTYQSGINARKISRKPLVVHIHATEFDRTGGSPNNFISKIEYNGLKEADLVIANSNFTKQNVIRCYKIKPEKIKVVHWGMDDYNPAYQTNYKSELNKKEKIVLFLGRVTLQKGPDYFIEVAKKVLDYYKKVRFVIAGDGDMMPKIINKSIELGIQDKITFTGFLQGNDVHKAFQTADIYVMPSVSEPFGLVALEALKNGTPVIISKQSGVAEVLNHALKVDFWDVNKMTNQIVSLLKYKDLHDELKQNSMNEVSKFNLDLPAKKIIQIYDEVRK